MYYIVETNTEDLFHIVECCVGTIKDLRYSLDGTKVIVRKANNNRECEALDKLEALNHDEAIEVMQSSELFDEELYNLILNT